MMRLAVFHVSNELIDITSLDPKIQRFVHLFTTGQYSNVKLADLLEVHPNTITNWLKRPDISSIIVDMQKQTHDIVSLRIKLMSTKALDKLDGLLDSPIDGVRMQAVKDTLDRGGHKSVQEIRVDKTVRTFEEKLKDIMDDTIDVEYEVVKEE